MSAIISSKPLEKSPAMQRLADKAKSKVRQIKK
jgi:hypothetical protein